VSSWSSPSGKRGEIAGFRRPAVRVNGARRHSTARGESTFAVRIRVHSPKAIVARVAVSTRPVCALLAVAATSHFCGFLLTMEQTSSSSSSSSRSMSIAVRGHSIDSILGVHGHVDVREKDRLTEKERERERTRERENARERSKHDSRPSTSRILSLPRLSVPFNHSNFPRERNQDERQKPRPEVERRAAAIARTRWRPPVDSNEAHQRYFSIRKFFLFPPGRKTNSHDYATAAGNRPPQKRALRRFVTIRGELNFLRETSAPMSRARALADVVGPFSVARVHF